MSGFGHRMNEDVVNWFSKFRLKEKEDTRVELDFDDIRVSKEECERSLVGKVWGVKEVNFS